ncbi:MAG: hypothetical protein IPK03_15940 [Bacteroidetes bacterium]|nr:hypothetical protein [Bacteroidota bacterium]
MQPFFLYAHILFGSLSLLLGGAAIAAKKGSALHIKSGKLYALSMLFTCVFSLFVSIPKANYFLVCIAFFSYYGVFMGQRYIHLKKIEHKSSIEKIGVAIGFISSLGMIATAIYFFHTEPNWTWYYPNCIWQSIPFWAFTKIGKSYSKINNMPIQKNG